MRPVPGGLAVGVLASLYLLPLDAWTGAFPAHMLRHMTLVALLPPLIVAAWPHWPEAMLPGVLLATVVEFAMVWGWHLPVLHEAAALSTPVFVLEQASFLLGGLLVWSSALRAREPLAGAGAMLLTTMHMTLLGALVILSPRILYATCAALSAQQAGGMLMLAIGTPVYLAGGLWLASKRLDWEAVR